jgi:hypothetical protein
MVRAAAGTSVGIFPPIFRRQARILAEQFAGWFILGFVVSG